ncbi:MAG: hypothetical protein LBR44_03350 [Clostridiales Family XIII bacterium]|jgi:hypothetical protein|nr:hypothetical protein [Clostridiales Family XIII bacterium]
MDHAEIILLLTGPVFFVVIYMKYRNIKERHHHESETPVQMTGLQQYDKLAQHLTGQRSPRLRDANDNRVQGSLVGSDPLGAVSGIGNLSNATGVLESVVPRGVGDILRRL